MSLLAWVFFGLIAGSIANLLDPEPSKGGILGSIILGVLGAVVGGYLANLLLGITITGFNFTSFAIAVVGSLVLLAIGRLFRGRSV